jgi:LCP family protein required for cell wall assembly
MARTRKKHERRPGGHPGLRKGFLVTAGVLALVLAGGSAFSIATIHKVDSNFFRLCQDPSKCDRTQQPVTALVPKCARQICNYLLLGSDSRQGFTPAEQGRFGSASSVTGQRSDSILLVHLDIPRNRTTVLSIPRDLLVNIPGHGQDKINAAFDYGPNVLIKTVQQLTGMQINHYVAINFTGFVKLVNAIGGVPICVSKPMNDPISGLHIPKAGCFTMYGAQALSFVRARHVRGDVIPDFSRITRQQTFFRALIQKVESANSITHYTAVVDAIKHNLVVDAHLNVFNLQDLAHRLEAIGQQGVDFRVVPAYPAVINGIDYVQLSQPDAGKCFKLIKAGKALGDLCKELPSTPVSPASVKVQIYDANSGGKAQGVAAFLAKSGFDVLPVTAPPAGIKKIGTILYMSRSGQAKNTIHTYLPNLPTKQVTKIHLHSDIVLIIGPGYRGPGA